MSGNGSPHYEDFLLPSDESVVLPSGMPAILRYPTMRYFLTVAALPSRLARSIIAQAPLEAIEKADKEDLRTQLSTEPLTAEQIEETETRSNLLLCDVFAKPRFSLTPKEGEYHPARLRMEDRTFVLNWASAQLGAIKRGGSADLETFRPQPAPDATTDRSGKVVG